MPESQRHAAQPRRQVLKAGGALAAATLLNAPLSSAAEAASAAAAPASAAAAPASATLVLPPLEIITLNRLAFGPRPGDLDAFRQMASSDKDRLASYIDQQLNPQSIDDTECG